MSSEKIMAAPNISPVPSPEATSGALDPLGTEEVIAWFGLLLRTLKTCRLYDEANPTVVKFREQTAASLQSLLERRDRLLIEVRPNALAVDGVEVQKGRSRDDNLAAVLYRDGIRSLSLEPGIESREVEALLNEILHVTGLSPGEEDLVTLLWEANLPHVAVETVPMEGDADGGGADQGAEEPALPWPKQDSHASAMAPESGARSDDWITLEHPTDIEQDFDEIENMALLEIARFRREYDASANRDVVTETLCVIEDCCALSLTVDDREVLVDFLPRVMREALMHGDWRSTSLALHLLRQCDPDWSVEGFSSDLCGPFSLTTPKVVAEIDRQGTQGIDSFLTLAHEFGPSLVEWLMHVLAESQQARVRRPLARAIAELLAGEPERVVPWLSDRRWYVVRNAVHILGWIGGNETAVYLGALAEHEEPRVRREVVAALSALDPDASRATLLSMTKDVDPALFGVLLQHFATDDHDTVTEALLGFLREESFARRSETERRTVFSALATRGEAVLPALEAALHEGGLFSRRPEPDRTGIALCIARIGTPAARGILEKGSRSFRGSIRAACQIAGGIAESK